MNKHSNRLRVVCRVSAFLLMLVMLVSVLGVTASAEGIQQSPYTTYTYWSAPGKSWTASSTPMYEVDTVINGASLGISSFGELNDIYTDAKGLIYIMDSDNGRIVVLNADYTLKTIIQNPTYNGEQLSIVGARGVFVTDDQKIYIADTENARVLIAKLDNTIAKALYLPEADVIPESFIYRPMKITVDSKGYTYILSEGSFYGALLYKPDGSFSGFYGANAVKTTILGAFQKIYERIFMSDTQKENQIAELPYSFSDIAIDDNDFVYTSTGATSTKETNIGQLKKLSPGGTNILKNKTTSNVVSAESTNFSDGLNTKIALSSGWYEYRVTDLSTMDVDKYGYMYGFDRFTGHIFIYDQECNLLTVFGGGNSNGEQVGTFTNGSAVHVNDITQDVLVVDPANRNLTIYKETEYGALVKKAQSLTNEGSYSESKSYWETALTYDRNQQLAYRGLARAALVEEEYDTCLEYAKMGFDQDTYSSAYKYVRNEYLTDNFVWIFLIAVVVCGGLVFLLVYSNKHELKLINNKKVSTMFQCIFHPFQGAQQVRYYGNGSTALATGCMVLYFFSTVINGIYSSFTFNMFDKSSYNVFYPLVQTFGLVLLWSVANWGMSTLFEGKGTMKEVYILTCYALIPLIINNFVLTLLSHTLTIEESLVLTAVNVICMALAAIMLSVGNMTAHEFGFFKFLVMTLITILAMFIVVFVILMLFVLVQQLTSFVGTIYKEISYR